ncbi:AfsR/SARP family transcriptional regulator [Flindersiella endophytica]
MEFRVLGPLELYAGERRIEIGAAKQRALLALLLLNANKACGRDRLIDDLWEGAPPRSARTTLQSCVYRLRRMLSLLSNDNSKQGGVYLHTRRDGYLLQVPDEAIDQRRFEQYVSEGWQAIEIGEADYGAGRLRSALELWHGEAYADIGVQAVRDQARRLDDRRLEVVEQCVAAEIGLGRHQTVVGELEDLTGAHPLRERLWELLLAALHKSGRRADALSAYQRLYRVLDEELGVEPGARIRDLHMQILNADPALDPPQEAPLDVTSAQVPLSTALPTDEPVAELAPPEPAPVGELTPRQLPVSIERFAGRGEVLEQLDALTVAASSPLAARDPATTATSVASAASPAPAPAIAVIVGMAGVGKSTLAVHWAHRVADRFPDGQLHVNLRGFDRSGEPMPAAEALRGFLDALQVPAARLPSDVEARAALYRSILAGKRMLIVLDNARDTEQVRPLLPAAPGCAVVVTSRRMLSGLMAAEGAHVISLGLLDPVDAWQLLADRLGEDRVSAEPAATRDIIRMCAGLPLALAISAARAATNPEFSLEVLAAELRDARGGLDAFADEDSTTDVRAVLSWSYQQLSAEAAGLFRLLGLHPGPDLSVRAAASLAGVPIRQARRLLGELTRCHLLTEHVPGRYSFHDLVRAFAVELVEAEEMAADRISAMHRVLDHYLHSAFGGVRVIYPDRDPITLPAALSGVVVERFAEREQAMVWFAAERRVLVAMISAAADSGLDDHCWQLAWSIATFLDWQGYWHDWRLVQETALEAAVRSASSSDQARCYSLVGHANLRLGDHEAAGANLAKAIDLYRSQCDDLGEARVHQIFFHLYEQQGYHGEGLGHAQRALELYRRAGQRQGEARALNAVGWFHALLGEYQQAIEYSGRALPILIELEDPQGQANTLDSLGYAYHRLGDFGRAAESYRRALDLFAEVGDRRNEAQTLVHLADSQHAEGRHDIARKTWQQALDILEELGLPEGGVLMGSPR